ncbi:MAG: MFS transporter [Devosia sp.]
MKLADFFGGLWRDRSFRTFWSAQTVSEFGDRITELALPLIAVTMLNATPAEVGLLTAAVWLPNLVSLFIGTWVDQQANKRGLMVAADLARTIVLLSLPIAYWLGALSLTHLFAVAILAGTAHVVFNTAYAAFFVRLVKSGDYLEANSKLSATRALSFVGGPAFAGLLIQWLTAPFALVADALSFVFSAIQIARLKIAPAPVVPTEEPLLRRVGSGMAYIFRHPILRTTLACAATVNFFTFIGTAIVILYASRNLGLDAGTIGLAFGIGASGGLLGAAFARPLAERVGMGWLIAVATIAFPGALAIIAFAEGPYWSRVSILAISEFISAFAVMCFDIPMMSLQVKVTHDNMRARVSGAGATINFGVRPLGAVIGGLLATWIGPRETLFIAAAGGALSVLWLVGSPVLRLKTIDEANPPPELGNPGA